MSPTHTRIFHVYILSKMSSDFGIHSGIFNFYVHVYVQVIERELPLSLPLRSPSRSYSLSRSPSRALLRVPSCFGAPLLPSPPIFSPFFPSLFPLPFHLWHPLPPSLPSPTPFSGVFDHVCTCVGVGVDRVCDIAYNLFCDARSWSFHKEFLFK